MIRPVPLSRLVRVFTLTGILSIGGGRAAFFYDALVTRRYRDGHWAVPQGG